MNLTQSWSKGKPVFFIEGRRVSLERGYNALIAQGSTLTPELDYFFKNNVKVNDAPFEFIILDDADAPKSKNICQKTRAGKAEYIHVYKRDMHVKPVTLYYPIPIEVFGLEVRINSGFAFFEKTRASIAVFSDGTPRNWQGEGEFKLPFWKLLS